MCSDKSSHVFIFTLLVLRYPLVLKPIYTKSNKKQKRKHKVKSLSLWNQNFPTLILALGPLVEKKLPPLTPPYRTLPPTRTQGFHWENNWQSRPHASPPSYIHDFQLLPPPRPYWKSPVSPFVRKRERMQEKALRKSESRARARWKRSRSNELKGFREVEGNNNRYL